MSYSMARKQAPNERVEMTIRKRRPLFARGMQGANNERLTRGVIFGTMADVEDVKSGRPGKN